MAPESNEEKLKKAQRYLADAAVYSKGHSALVALLDGHNPSGDTPMELILRLPDNSCLPPIYLGRDRLGTPVNEEVANKRLRSLLSSLINTYADKYSTNLREAQLLVGDLVSPPEDPSKQ